MYFSSNLSLVLLQFYLMKGNESWKSNQVNLGVTVSDFPLLLPNCAKPQMGLENFVAVAASSADDAMSYFQTSLEKRKK